MSVLIFVGHELCGEGEPAQMPVETSEKEMPTQLQEALKFIKVGFGQYRLANLPAGRF